MANLTKTQIDLLYRGASDPGGAIQPLTFKDKPPAALSAALGALRRKGLAEKASDGSWQITTAGRETVSPTSSSESPPATPANGNTDPEAPPVAAPLTKRRHILVLLQQEQGVSMAEMMQATGWQAHSVRALLSGLRKKDLAVVCTKQADGPSRYRISAEQAAV